LSNRDTLLESQAIFRNVLFMCKCVKEYGWSGVE